MRILNRSLCFLGGQFYQMDIEKVLSIKNFRSQLQRKGDCGNILSNDLIECCMLCEERKCFLCKIKKAKGRFEKQKNCSFAITEYKEAVERDILIRF